MRIILKTIIASFFIFLFLYVLPPSPDFPKALPDTLQSKEPADTETPLRRAYFTNFTREEVMSHYNNQFKWGYRLNYPPEESQTIIRDQTRSTFLEEIAHPLRESIFVNGFEPKDPKDAIFIEGKPWRQKIVVKYLPSNIFLRAFVVILTGLVSLFLLNVWLKKHD